MRELFRLGEFSPKSSPPGEHFKYSSPWISEWQLGKSSRAYFSRGGNRPSLSPGERVGVRAGLLQTNFVLGCSWATSKIGCTLGAMNLMRGRGREGGRGGALCPRFMESFLVFRTCPRPMNRAIGAPVSDPARCRRVLANWPGRRPALRFMGSPLSFLSMHWDHEPDREFVVRRAAQRYRLAL